MRRSPLAALALSVALAAGAVAIAGAASTRIPQFPVLAFDLDVSASPKKLPKNELAPVGARISGKVRTTDGTHPSALREVVLDVDKDVAVSVRGLPVCKGGLRDMRKDPATVGRICGKAKLGKGRAHIEIAFPGLEPLIVKSPITVFNGGEKGNKVKLLIHTFITVPVPAAIVTQVTVQRKGTGVHSVAKIPPIAGGGGSIIEFDLRLKRIYAYKGQRHSFLTAKCPDGEFKVTSPKTVFKNEAKIPGVAAQTILKGGLVVPCTPKG